MPVQFAMADNNRMEVSIHLASGSTVSFDVDKGGQGKAIFVLGVRKCGSTLLNKICTLLAKANATQFVDVAGTFFRSNLNAGLWINDPAVRQLVHAGNVYGGFRNMPACLKDMPDFTDGRKVLLVRDPRDALVSEYFSNAYSHAIPPGEGGKAGARKNLLAQRQKALASTIDDYVVARARLMRRTFSEYADLWSSTQILRLRYEEVIFSKSKMIDDIVAQFGWICSEDWKVKILEQVDLRPEAEDPQAFVRKVTPGDHMAKLSPDTIAILNTELSDVLCRFGYAP